MISDGPMYMNSDVHVPVYHFCLSYISLPLLLKLYIFALMTKEKKMNFIDNIVLTLIGESENHPFP